MILYFRIFYSISTAFLIFLSTIASGAGEPEYKSLTVCGTGANENLCTDFRYPFDVNHDWFDTSQSTSRSTSFASFDTSNIRKWDEFEIEPISSAKQVNVKLNFIDTTFYENDIPEYGIGYRFNHSSYIHPQVLAEEYSAYLLCYTWDEENNEADHFYDNIPGSRIINTDDFFGASFKIGSSDWLAIDRCIVEISANTDPYLVVYKSNWLETFGDNGQALLSRPEETLVLLNNPPITSLRDKPELRSDELTDMSLTDLEKFVQSLELRNSVENYLTAECARDENSIDCRGHGYQLLSATGTISGNRPNRELQYELSCFTENSDLETCFLPGDMANKSALWTVIDPSTLPICSDNFQGELCRIFEAPFRDDHFGKINANTLYELKWQSVTYVHSPARNKTYLLNKCVAQTSKATIVGSAVDIPYSCEFGEEMAKRASIQHADIDRDALRFLRWKRVRAILVSLAAFMLAGAVGGFALGSTFVTLAGQIGTAASYFFAATAVITIPQSAIKLKQCETQECRINERFNLAESATDIIDPLSIIPASEAAAIVRKVIARSSDVLLTRPTLRNPQFSRNLPEIEAASKLLILEADYPALGHIISGSSNWSDISVSQRLEIVNILRKKSWNEMENPEFHEYLAKVFPPQETITDVEVNRAKRRLERGQESWFDSYEIELDSLTLEDIRHGIPGVNENGVIGASANVNSVYHGVSLNEKQFRKVVADGIRPSVAFLDTKPGSITDKIFHHQINAPQLYSKSIFVSTSTDISVAQKYATDDVRTNYVFVVTPLPGRTVDVVGTFNHYGKNASFPEEKEMSVIGTIYPEYIQGYYINTYNPSTGEYELSDFFPL